MTTHTPTLLALFVLAGIVAGATASAVGAVLAPRPVAPDPGLEWLRIDPEGVRSMTERLEDLLERKERDDVELAAPAPAPRTEVGGGSAATAEALARIAEQLDELATLLARTPRADGRALHSNTGLPLELDQAGVDSALVTLRNRGDAGLRDEFMLLSIQEAIEQFGRPSGSSNNGSAIRLYWRRPSGNLYADFIDGLACQVSGKLR
ncbi:MAG: hypothetical protein AAF726_05290 [Planctomycetota bacterium]